MDQDTDMGEHGQGAHPGSEELRLILVGTIDCGKTLTADTLLGQVQTSFSPGSWRSCHLRQGLSHSRRLTVVEAPRWYWSGDCLESNVHEETKRALDLVTPGPHCFLLLIPVNQFTEMERRAAQQIEEVFGQGALQHSLVLLTCGDYLLGRPVEDYLARENQGFREVIDLCEGRYHVINNRRPEEREQVLQLLNKVESMVQQKGGYFNQDTPRPGSLIPNRGEQTHVVDTKVSCSTARQAAEPGGLMQQIMIEEEQSKRRENERLEKEKEERRVKKRLEAEKVERERLEMEMETERLKTLEKETERREKERKEREQLLSEEMDKKMMERESKQILIERKEVESRIWERMHREKVENETLERERPEMEKLESIAVLRREEEAAERGRLEQEKIEKERREKESIEKLKEGLKQEKLETEHGKEGIDKENLEIVRNKDRSEKERKKQEKTQRLEEESTETEVKRIESVAREMFKKEQEGTNTERAEIGSKIREIKKQMKEVYPKQVASACHSQMLSRKKEPFEQHLISEDKHTMTEGTSQPVQPEGAVLSKFSEAADKGELKEIYGRIVTTGEDPSVTPGLRLVLLGRSRSGKSAAGNMILGRQEFQTQHNMAAVTQQCEKGRAILGNRQVAVVDTPDWFQSQCSPEEVRSQLSSCVALSSPGPHAFLLCVPLHQPPPDTMQMLDAMEGVFGSRAVNAHTVLLFTYSDILGDRIGKTGDRWGTAEVEEYILAKLPNLLKLVERCSDHYHILQREEGRNSGGVERNEGGRDKEGTERSSSIEELLEKVEQMVLEGGGNHYSCQLYQEAESRVRQRQEEILQARRDRKMELRRSKELIGGDHMAPSRQLVFLEKDEEGVEDEVMALERAREEAEKSITLDSVPALSFSESKPRHSSLIHSTWEKALAGVRGVPKPLVGGALVGCGLGAFLGGLLWGVVGATGGAALAEVTRRKLSKQGDDKRQTEKDRL